MAKSPITFETLENTLSDLDVHTLEAHESQQFDLAETLETAGTLLRLLRDTDLLTEAAEDDQPIPASMESLRNLCVEMKALQNKAAALKDQATEVRIPLDNLRMKQIPEMMESLQLKTATFAGLGRVQVAPDLRASTRKGMKPAAMQWLRDQELDGMISETYNATSMKALLRRMIVDGVDIPDDIFNVTPFSRASIVKA
ncbi:hypothetical protein UFOVP580_49 [uncultured Caudovirales phage]|uniref:Siphovirus Gp157 n=1 Tax=uncultured Caudovirales phage TaxID=2100421 RepID=A0A6J5PA76_9CAUD|nr:hypothetical protein UFOVP580_49 [uncultured Caudovirales phage]